MYCFFLIVVYVLVFDFYYINCYPQFFFDLNFFYFIIYIHMKCVNFWFIFNIYVFFFVILEVNTFSNVCIIKSAYTHDAPTQVLTSFIFSFCLGYFLGLGRWKKGNVIIMIPLTKSSNAFLFHSC